MSRRDSLVVVTTDNPGVASFQVWGCAQLVHHTKLAKTVLLCEHHCKASFLRVEKDRPGESFDVRLCNRCHSLLPLQYFYSDGRYGDLLLGTDLFYGNNHLSCCLKLVAFDPVATDLNVRDSAWAACP